MFRADARTRPTWRSCAHPSYTGTRCNGCGVIQMGGQKVVPLRRPISATYAGTSLPQSPEWTREEPTPPAEREIKVQSRQGIGGKGAPKRSATHYPCGHARADNSYLHNGTLRCRICRNVRQKAYMQRRRAKEEAAA